MIRSVVHGVARLFGDPERVDYSPEAQLRRLAEMLPPRNGALRASLPLVPVRTGPAHRWRVWNPILADGEVGVATDIGVSKRGDGKTRWNDLP